MYFKLFLESFEKKLGGGREGGIFRSITVTGFIIILLIVAASAAYIEHGRGNIQKIKRHLRTPQHVDPAAPHPGGQDAVILSRPQTPDATQPEFISATLLPGRGLNVLQINAFVPGRGEIGLLASPTLADAARAMSGVDDDSEGQASLTDGAAFLVPWAGRLSGVASLDGKSSSVPWKGTVLNLPANNIETQSSSAYGGLLLNEPSASIQTTAEPDGASATAVFSSVGIDDQWPSTPETTISVHLNGKAIEMTVRVKNIGTTPLPAGIGWAPRFYLRGGDRSKVTLHLPATMRAELRDTRSGMPNGILRPIAGTENDFSSRNGAPLGNSPLGDTFVHLKTSAQDNAIELRDPLARFGIRMTPLSDSIKAIHVFSPVGSNFVSISPQMNYDDPLGHEWAETEDTGLAVLSPGQTVEWKIRLEIFSVNPTK
jgi:aldose 1-epimerase